MNHDRKLDALLRILQDKKVQRVIVFCRTKRSTFWLNQSLRRSNQDAIALNGDLTQHQRDVAMNSFRRGQSRILVATDLAGRGLDVNGVTHIINYDVPQDPYAYFHRIGRTGRAGKSGTAVTIVSAEQNADFRTIQSMADDRIERLNFNSDPSESPARREGSRNLDPNSKEGPIGIYVTLPVQTSDIRAEGEDILRSHRKGLIRRSLPRHSPSITK